MDDITFITMHDLSPEARLVYASHSITEVLGYDCQEIVGRSCFEYFHPDERPFAQSVHGRGVKLDKAAVLSYCRLKTAGGNYVTCECVFTVVYSVIVASTSLYRPTSRSQSRAMAAPAIRRAFSSSPADPRFHMLTHLSEKFKAPPPGAHEPRAALILNRFTKTCSILYASSALNDLLRVELDRSVGISFYECIQRECLEEAIQAIEHAKENDSIAYLRFIWRNPGEDPDGRDPTYGEGGDAVAANGSENERARRQSPSAGDSARSLQSLLGYSNGSNLSHNGGGSSSNGGAAQARLSEGDKFSSPLNSAPGPRAQPSALVVEAVVSCTSDGLVVVLRKARPIIPLSGPLGPPIGQFVSPWSTAACASRRRSADEMDAPVSIPVPRLSGPAAADFMESIRQVAVFAWSLRSINEELLQYARPPGAVEGKQPAQIGEVVPNNPEDNSEGSGDRHGEKGSKRLKASHGGGLAMDGAEEGDGEVDGASEGNRGQGVYVEVDKEADGSSARGGGSDAVMYSKKKRQPGEKVSG